MRAPATAFGSTLLLVATLGAPARAEEGAAAPAPPAAVPGPVKPAAPAPPRARRQEEVMIGGLVLIGMGAFITFPGVWLATNPPTGTGGRGGSRFAVLGVAGGLVVSGVVLAAVGGTPPSGPTAPRVAIGATSASMTWRF